VRPLSDTDFLSLWERGSRCHPLDRALLALAAAFPETPYDQLADWPLGRRNQALARLRCRCFGPTLRAWTTCSACGEKLELAVDGELLAAGDPEADGRGDRPVSAVGRSFRLPTSRDLARAARAVDPDAGARQLVGDCLVSARPPGAWSDEEVAEIGAQMAVADPQAEMTMAMRCPSCGREWQEPLDVGSYFWTELEARVRQLLRTLHVLASAYGWSEAEILALSERRRALYREMIES
jgi:hypothetical protein